MLKEGATELELELLVWHPIREALQGGKFTAEDIANKLTPLFAERPGAVVMSVCRLYHLHKNWARELRASDAEAAEGHTVAAHKLEQMVTYLVGTLSTQATIAMLATRRGDQALTLLLQLGCRTPIARPNVQSAMHSLWQGGDTAKQTALAAWPLLMLLAALVLVTVIVLVAAAPAALLPLVEAPLWARAVQLAAHTAVASLLSVLKITIGWNNEKEKWGALAGFVFSGFAAWSAVHLATPELAPTLLGALSTHRWWLRLLEALLPIALGGGLCVVGNNTNNTPLVLVGVGLFAFLLAPAAAPAAAVPVALLIAGPLAAVAVVPALERQLCPPPEGTDGGIASWWGRNSFAELLPTPTGLLLLLHIFRLPVVKFYAAIASRLLLAVALVADVRAGDALEHGRAYGVGLLLWSLAASVEELRDLVTSRALWLLDKLNWLELIGVVAAAVGQQSAVGFPLFTLGTADSVRSAGVLCLLMSQGLRVLQRFPSTGPLVLMCIDMTLKDLTKWLLLTVVGVVAPFALAMLTTFHDIGDEDALEGECEGFDAKLANLLLNPFVLINAVIGGGARARSRPRMRMHTRPCLARPPHPPPFNHTTTHLPPPTPTPEPHASLPTRLAHRWRRPRRLCRRVAAPGGRDHDDAALPAPHRGAAAQPADRPLLKGQGVLSRGGWGGRCAVEM